MLRKELHEVNRKSWNKATEATALAPSGYEPGVQDFVNPFPANEFQWTLSEIVSAILDAGLALRSLKEYPYANGARLFKGMEERANGRIYPPADQPSLPLMYGLAAEKV